MKANLLNIINLLKVNKTNKTHFSDKQTTHLGQNLAHSLRQIKHSKMMREKKFVSKI